MNYAIDDENGQQLARGITGELRARQAAALEADRRGRSVWMYREGEEGESIEVRPDPMHVGARVQTRCTGEHDYDAGTVIGYSVQGIDPRWHVDVRWDDGTGGLYPRSALMVSRR